MRVCASLCLLLLVTGAAWAQQNPEYIFSIDGPCGELVVGEPGTVWDDGTNGEPYFRDSQIPGGRIGMTLDVLVSVSEKQEGGCCAYAYAFALGREGPIEFVGATTWGTSGCPGNAMFPECLVGASGSWGVFLTGPPHGRPPTTEENAGMVVWAVLSGVAPIFLPSGVSKVGKARLFAEFPSEEGDDAIVRLFFTERRTESGGVATSFFPLIIDQSVFSTGITQEAGDPPLTVVDCSFTLKASRTAAFLRCDADSDGRLRLTDAIRTLEILFREAPAPECRAALDCNDDGARDVSDAIYGLQHLFVGGPPPPAPYPRCDTVVGLEREDCPLGSTVCRRE